MNDEKRIEAAARPSEQTRDAAKAFVERESQRPEMAHASEDDVYDVFVRFADQQTAAVRHRLEAALKVIEHYADANNWHRMAAFSELKREWASFGENGYDKAAEFLNHAEEKSDEN